jgi:hypothetical protein
LRLFSNSPVTAADIEECLDIVAGLADGENGEQYIPLFERLEKELAAMDQKRTTLDRIKARRSDRATVHQV